MMQVAAPIKDIKNVVSTLISTIFSNESYQDYLKQLETGSDVDQKKADIIKKTASNISVYTVEQSAQYSSQPLFLAKDIGILMGVANITGSVKNFTPEERVDVAHVNSNGRVKPFLTRHGVYRVLMNSRTKLSELFRSFIYKLLDHVTVHEIEKMRAILAECVMDDPNRARQSMLEIYDGLEKYKEMYEKEHAGRLVWEEKAEDEHIYVMKMTETAASLETGLNMQQMHIVQLENDTRAYIERLKSLRAVQNDESTHIIESLKKRFMKPFYVYLVRPEALVARKRGVASAAVANSGGDGGAGAGVGYADEFRRVTGPMDRDHTLFSDLQLYYYLSMVKKNDEKYVEICVEYVFDKAAFCVMTHELQKFAHDGSAAGNVGANSGVFYTTLDTIRDAATALICE